MLCVSRLGGLISLVIFVSLGQGISISVKWRNKFGTMNNKFDEQSRQFNELKFDINQVKVKCESRCNELKQDIEKVVESVGEQIKSCLLYTSRCV